MRSLAGMTAVVAGAGPGIGRACAAILRREGADVVAAARDAARLEAMTSDMLAGVASEPGPRLQPIAFDFADLRSCQDLLEEVLKRFGRIDILVNVAAAGGEPSAVAEGEWQAWRRAFEVNVIGTMELSRLAATAMRANPGGSIVQIGTVGTKALPPGRASYTATKSAMVAASLTMAKEVGRDLVRVNVVTPGFVTGAPLSAMLESVAARRGESSDEASARLAAEASLRRHVDPADVAEAVAFLAGPGARNITGIELPVTAGR